MKNHSVTRHRLIGLQLYSTGGLPGAGFVPGLHAVKRCYDDRNIIISEKCKVNVDTPAKDQLRL